MRIQHIKISNILGIEELELSPKGYTQISGANGKGKTSVLEAIKSALGAGEDATLLRNGADRGEVVLLLDDGTEIRKAVSAAGVRTTVKDAAGKQLQKPAAVIQGLADVMSVNPVEFLLAPKKERVRVLLDAMPLDADVDRLREISGVAVEAPPGAHALHVIDSVHKQVYDDRTGTNRAVKEKEGTISQLRQAMPEAPAGAEGDEATLEAEIEAATKARDEKLDKIKTKLDGIKTTAQARIDAIRTKLQADIDALKAAAQAEVDTVNADVAENERRANAAHQTAVTSTLEATQAKRNALQAIRANRDAVVKRSSTLGTIAKMEREVEQLRADADRQTAALAAIEAYKSDLLSSLPIAGLEVRDGEVFRDGVPLDRLNTAQQVQIAVDVAQLRAGDLGIACVDRLESLDAASRDALRKSALAAGLQLFVTRVTDGEFTVNTAG